MTPDTEEVPETQRDLISSNTENDGEEQEILRTMDGSRDEILNRRVGNPLSSTNSCDTSNFPEKFTEPTDKDEDDNIVPDSIKIKLKYLNDQVKTVRALPNDLIADFKKYVYMNIVKTLNKSKNIQVLIDLDVLLFLNSKIHCNLSFLL